MVKRRITRTRRPKRPSTRRITKRRRPLLRRRHISNMSVRTAGTRPGRSFKPARSLRPRPLALLRSLERGRTLPRETSAKFVLTVNGTWFGNSSNALNRTFVLNSLNGPFIPGKIFPGFDTQEYTWAYRSVWEKLYSRYLVTGSKLTYTIRPKAIPTNIAYPSDSANTTMHGDGYWYIRYYKARPLPTDGTSTTNRFEFEGHPMPLNSEPEIALWPNKRSFLEDPTVTWFKSKNAHITGITFTVDVPESASNTVRMFPAETNNTVPAGSRASYTVRYPRNRRRFIMAYSHRDMRKHYPKERVSLLSQASSFSNLSSEKDLPWNELLTTSSAHGARGVFGCFARFGYISFDPHGVPDNFKPLSSSGYFESSVHQVFKVRLFEPIPTPWGEENLPQTETSARVTDELDMIVEPSDDPEDFSEDPDLLQPVAEEEEPLLETQE